MPDIGGFGRGLLKGALSATEKAAEKVKDAAEAASRKLSADDGADTKQAVKAEAVLSEAPAAAPVAVAAPEAPPVAGNHAPTPDDARILAAVGTAAEVPGDLADRVADSTDRAAAGWAGNPTDRAGDAAAETLDDPADRADDADQAAADRADDLTDRSGIAAAEVPGDAADRADGAADRAAAARADDPTDRAGHAAAEVSGDPTDRPGDDSAETPGDPTERADESDVREFVEMFQRLLDKRRPPEGPIPGEWSFGVGDLLAEHPKVPKRIRGLITKLNRFGGVAYSPQEVVFDGDDVPWEKVTEVRTRHIVDYLVGDAVQQQVENLPVPWFPGRGRLLDALGQALLTVTIATAKDQIDKLDLDVRVPAEVVYKASFGRSKELGAGVISALVLADPAVNRSFVATARDRGITVTAADDEMLANAEERAAQIREKVKALEAVLDRFGRKG